MQTVTESLEPSATLAATAGIRAAIREDIAVPAFTFDLSCSGPNDRDRDDYLRLLFDAEQARKAGDASRYAGLKRDAETLVRDQWRETFHNLVTTAGKNDVLDKYFKGSSYTAAWYAGLKGSGSAAAGDTASSHSGWSEVTAYSAGTRPAISFGTSGSGSNTASQISYSMNGAYTVAGLFIISNSTKGGTTGTLYSAGDIAAARTGDSGDTLNLTPTVSF